MVTRAKRAGGDAGATKGDGEGESESESESKMPR